MASVHTEKENKNGFGVDNQLDGKENDMELISREEAMRLLKEDYYASRSRGDDERAEVCLLHSIDISNLPTVEEREEGRWIAIDKDDINYDYYECSNCRSEISVDHKKVCDIGFVIEDFKYCPRCGARMRGE